MISLVRILQRFARLDLMLLAWGVIWLGAAAKAGEEPGEITGLEERLREGNL